MIEGWVLLPPDYGSGAGAAGRTTSEAPRLHPLVVAIHGGPHSAYGESFSFQQQLWAAQGYLVLATNPRGSTGYGEDFLWATWGGWGNLDFDDVMAGVDHVVANYNVDPQRIGVTGYSYGGFLTNWAITHTDRFAATISGAGISNWLSDYGTADIPQAKETEFFGAPWKEPSAELLWEQSPIKHADGVSTPTLFIHGEEDFRVPIEQGRADVHRAAETNRRGPFRALPGYVARRLDAMEHGAPILAGAPVVARTSGVDDPAPYTTDLGARGLED